VWPPSRRTWRRQLPGNLPPARRSLPRGRPLRVLRQSRSARWSSRSPPSTAWPRGPPPGSSRPRRRSRRRSRSATSTPGADPAAAAAAEPERTVVLEVTAEHGLHARPAARFVQTVAAFPATVRVRNLDTGRGPVDARSLTSLATLDARQGHRIEVTADGDGAEEVLRALEELAGTQFGDAPGSEPQPGTAGAA